MSNIKMVTAWPHITKGQSFQVSVSLVATPYLKTQLTTTVRDEKTSMTINSDLTPVGTPGTPMKNVFGSGYNVYAVAELDGSAFEIKPNTQNPQPLDQHIVSFYWSIFPNAVGLQTIEVSLD